MKKNMELLILLIVVILVGFYRYSTVFELTTTQAESLIGFIPDFALFIVTAYVFTSSRGLYRVGAFIMSGVAVSYFLGNAHAEGLITSVMLQGLTVAQLQVLVLSVSVFLGALIYVASK